MKNKRGWMLILEATIAVLIVSGVLITVYSQQVDRGIDPVDYYNSLQGQILADVSERSDLRLNVLNVESEDLGDGNFTTLNDFIGGKIPESFGYSIRVCELGDEVDYCKMRAPIFIATMDKDIYVEEIVVSAELGEGTDAVYSPKKLKLFVWEGEDIEVDCFNECEVEETIFGCKDESTISKRECGNFDNDFCLEYAGEGEEFEDCEEGKECIKGLGLCDEPLTTFELTCSKRVITETGCVHNFDDECNEWDGGSRTGSCGPWYNRKDSYQCWNDEEVITECSEEPVSCPEGVEVARSGCVIPAEECEDSCSADVYSCDGDDAKILVKECKDLNEDGCLELDNVKVFKSCGTGKMCVAGSSVCMDKTASLSASYVMGTIANTGGGTYYYYTSIISESAGVGVTIGSRQKCYVGTYTNKCDAIKYNIATDYGTNYISSNGQISDPINYFWTDEPAWTTTETFLGTDDNGNSVSASYSISI